MCLGPPKMAIIAQRFNAGLSLQRGHESRWDERNVLSPLSGLLCLLPNVPSVKTLGYCQTGLPMCLDEFGWIEPTARVFAVTRADERREEFAHFKVKMGEITAVGGADRRDLLAAFHRFPRMHERRSPAIAGRRRNDVTNFIDHTLRFGQSQTSCADC